MFDYVTNVADPAGFSKSGRIYCQGFVKPDESLRLAGFSIPDSSYLIDYKKSTGSLRPAGFRKPGRSYLINVKKPTGSLRPSRLLKIFSYSLSINSFCI